MCDTCCGEIIGDEHEAILEMVNFLTDTLAELAVNDDIEDITYTEMIDRDTGLRTFTIEIVKR
jgi:hypothetical protein